MTIEPQPCGKKALRKEMRQRLRDHPTDSRELLHELRSILQELEGGKIIAIYAALPDEPLITDLVKELPQHQWQLPRVDGDDLIFHRVTDPDTELRLGAYDIREPMPSLPTTAIQDIDIFVCPGIAFDPQGGRLGRGRGFYDRMLSQAREDALKIGVGFSVQMVEDVFTEEHDIAMNSVLCIG